MTYYESAEGARITRDRVVREMRRHGVPAAEIEAFCAEVGEPETYDAQAMLAWLGY